MAVIIVNFNVFCNVTIDWKWIERERYCSIGD